MLGRTINTKFAQQTSEPIASGKTVVITGKLFDEKRQPLLASDLAALTLTIVDKEAGAIVNGVEDEDILNTGRGAFDGAGNLVVTLTSDDTLLPAGIKRAIRSLVFNWEYGFEKTGGHQFDFKIAALGN